VHGCGARHLTIVKRREYGETLNIARRTIAARMVDNSQPLQNYRTMKPDQAVRALGALAQATRLEVFRLLVKAGPAGMSAGKIGEALDVAPATLSFHLKELAQAGLVEARQENRFIYYSADFRRMNGLLAFLTQNCCEGGGCELPQVQALTRMPGSRREGRRA
jgi:ArsR family transcriptional regulator